MKALKTLFYILGTCLIGVGVATFVTNPDPDSYETYATQQLTRYLSENTCPQAGILQDPCISALENNQAQIRQLVAANTDRQNFWFWSIYRTDLSLDEAVPSVFADLVPSYYFESVGVFSSFVTYKAERMN